MRPRRNRAPNRRSNDFQGVRFFCFRQRAAKALNRPDEAGEQLDEVMKRYGDPAAYQYVESYAQRGEKNMALQPIRQEARFREVFRKMNFPS